MIKLSINMSTYSKGGPSVSSEEGIGVCVLKGCVIGSDSCAVPGQVAKLVVVGCSTTSSVGCSSVAADVVPVSPLPVLRFREYRELVVFAIGVTVTNVSLAPPVFMYESSKSCRDMMPALAILGTFLLESSDSALSHRDLF